MVRTSDYKISSFELELVLIEHRDVVGAAVVQALDVRLAVPRRTSTSSAATYRTRGARSILPTPLEWLEPYHRCRQLEPRTNFSDDLWEQSVRTKEPGAETAHPIPRPSVAMGTLQHEARRDGDPSASSSEGAKAQLMAARTVGSAR